MRRPQRRPFIVAARTDVGKLHPTNQDAVAVQLPGFNTLNAFFAVADGISSLPNSEASSRLALEVTRRALFAIPTEPARARAPRAVRDPDQTPGRGVALGNRHRAPPALPLIETADAPQKHALLTALAEASRTLQAQAAQAQVQVMGTTIAGLFVGVDRVGWVFSVGDSRVYRLRGSQFTQLTEDQIVPLPEGTSPKRSTRLSMYIGQPNTLTPFIAPHAIQPGDRFLICSDGLWSLFTPDELCRALMRFAPDEAADRLLADALERGAPDNVSLIVVSYKAASGRRRLIVSLLIALSIVMLAVVGIGLIAAFVLKIDLPILDSVRHLAGQ